ncbi:MAG TPA: hypothetical protein VN493_03395 [Thermoanaerobaculia bacterium]|nr:hypothetical protein [Thermoanaerobaculia bacterium]
MPLSRRTRESFEYSLFLSEFSGSLAFNKTKQDWLLKLEKIPLLISALGVSALILGQLSGANGLRGTLHNVQMVTDGSQLVHVVGPFEIKAGFLVELNHGIFYALTFPLFSYFCLQFFRLMSVAFWDLLENKRLDPPSMRTLFGIWKRNYLAFRRVPIFLLLFSLLFLSLDERRKYQLVESGASNLLGWVQADLTDEWKNAPGATSTPLVEPSGLEDKVRAELRLHYNAAAVWKNSLDLRGEALEEALQSGSYDINWDHVFKNKLVTFDRRVEGGVVRKDAQGNITERYRS